MSRDSKQSLIDAIAEQFRISGNQENAFDNLAAQRLEVNRTGLNCLDILQRAGPMTAGQLALDTGLTTGAVTAVLDRLEELGYARRIRGTEDRRQVMVEVTPALRKQAWAIWGPLKADWDAGMAKFSAAQLEQALEFIRASNEIAGRHIERLRGEI